MRERDIEQHLVKRVKALGGEVRKVQWIGHSGAPDRLVMANGDDMAALLLRSNFAPHCAFTNRQLADLARAIVSCYLVWPELKAPGVKPEPHQLREHARMRAMGQHVVVIDSIEGVEELLS